MKKLILIVSLLLCASFASGEEWKVQSKNVGPLNSLTQQYYYTIWFEPVEGTYELVLLNKVTPSDAQILNLDKSTKLQVKLSKNDKIVNVTTGAREFEGIVVTKLDLSAEQPIQVTTKYKAGNWFRHKASGREGIILATMRPQDETILVRFRTLPKLDVEIPRPINVYPSEITLIPKPQDVE